MSVPYLLNQSADRLSRGLSTIYQYHLVRSLREKIKRKFSGKTTMRFDLGKLDRVRSFYQFDDAITAPMHSFAGADDYCRQPSSRQYLSGIRVPALLIHALDDPFMLPESVPDENELSENVMLELAEIGGHVGFVGGRYPWEPVYWLEQRIIHYLEQYLT